jgi:hypothetical protein
MNSYDLTPFMTILSQNTDFSFPSRVEDLSVTITEACIVSVYAMQPIIGYKWYWLCSCKYIYFIDKSLFIFNIHQIF